MCANFLLLAADKLSAYEEVDFARERQATEETAVVSVDKETALFDGSAAKLQHTHPERAGLQQQCAKHFALG